MLWNVHVGMWVSAFKVCKGGGGTERGRENEERKRKEAKEWEGGRDRARVRQNILEMEHAISTKASRQACVQFLTLFLLGE